MGERRNARELALQALFFIDLNGENSMNLFGDFCNHFQEMIDERVNESQRNFFVHLVEGVLGCIDEIDESIRKSSTNWRISRMPVTDRNIIRIAVYELLKCPDIPPGVSINEAVDLGKMYGTAGSSAFINGVLDRIRETATAIEPPKES
ncbi:MAG: transcription antitermination factor NusB [Desulfamplus sp.]|nr:transcription antitermination factor NusB [Desulfamplus sp.]